MCLITLSVNNFVVRLRYTALHIACTVLVRNYVIFERGVTFTYM